MKEGVSKMQQKYVELKEERDMFKRRLERMDVALRKGKRTHHTNAKELVELRRQLDASQELAKTAQDESRRLGSVGETLRAEARVATSTLAQVKAEAAQSQAKHEEVVRELMRERDGFKRMASKKRAPIESDSRSVELGPLELESRDLGIDPCSLPS